MPSKPTIHFPTNYVAPSALGFADRNGTLALVSGSDPLPVRVMTAAEAIVVPAALAGETAKTTVVGPFKPASGTPIHLQLSGSWTGSVTVERSMAGGKSRQALTIGGTSWAVFSGNVNEPIWQENEAGVEFWLNIQVRSGTVSYRLSQ